MSGGTPDGFRLDAHQQCLVDALDFASDTVSHTRSASDTDRIGGMVDTFLQFTTFLPDATFNCLQRGWVSMPCYIIQIQLEHRPVTVGE